jgi:hypothetical protein
MYKEKEDLDFPPPEHASAEDVNKLRGASLQERAERSFYIYVQERLERIRNWAVRQMHYHHCEDLPLRLRFDEESGLWLCMHCGQVNGEEDVCWACKETRSVEELPESDDG